MAQIYFESDKLKDLSNIELIKCQNELSKKMTMIQKKYFSKEIIEQLNQMYDLYTAELDRRYAEDLIDDDEIEEIFENDENMIWAK